jgi:site-specific DNA-methyltransferase (adenine-specific)
MRSEVYNGDCVEFMRGLPDNCYSLAICDPPYGIDAGKMQMGKGKSQQWQKSGWDSSPPTAEYFTELSRVSKRQIIWGGNYFTLPSTGGWLFWNKDRQKDVSFADGELAWTSFLSVLKEVKVRYDGFIGADEVRIHATQKPIALYRRLLLDFAQTGDTILDTHLGSGSLRIACYDLGFDFTGCELDTDYFNAQEQRFKDHCAQPKLFEAPRPIAIQEPMFA